MNTLTGSVSNSKVYKWHFDFYSELYYIRKMNALNVNKIVSVYN